MRYLQTQVGRRRGATIGGEDGVGEFEEGVSPAVEAFVERELRKARRASGGGSMVCPSCTHRESSASFAARGVKTQAKVNSRKLDTRLWSSRKLSKIRELEDDVAILGP